VSSCWQHQISLLWCFGDPYTSVVLFSIKNGLLTISVQCVSEHHLRWVVLLLVYIIALSLILVTFAILTRNIKYRDFKDTMKISVLSFLLVFTCANTIFYWFLLRIIGADVILSFALLHIGHYCVILECQGFIFAPKLFPIVKEILIRRLHRASNTPTPKTALTNTH
jgi:hypothetical protein